MAMIYASGHISVGHITPIVTLTLAYVVLNAVAGNDHPGDSFSGLAGSEGKFAPSPETGVSIRGFVRG
jgi:hypothetical protein